MSRPFKTGVILILAIVLTGLWLFFRPIGNYQTLNCERHELELEHDGDLIVGIEDMAYDQRKGQIYFSAYNRREGKPGGIYRLDAGYNNKDIRRLSLPQTNTKTYWPHGIHLSYQEDQTRLDVIERDLRVKGRQKAQISQYRWNITEPKDIKLISRIEDDLFCSANNLSFSTSGSKPRDIYITRDHFSCSSWQQKLDNVFKPKSSSLLRMRQDAEAKPTVIVKNLSYANGIAPHPYSGVYTSETRKKRVSQQLRGGKIPRGHSAGNVTLPGGPDNLTVTPQGDVLAALHPNLIRFAAFRAGWGPRVKSRFAIISSDKSVNTYDVPADILSGATVALRVDESVYLGGAFDEAIAICKLTGIVE